MKISGLALLAIIIILPMAILLNSYASNQIKTIDLQVSYDSKLQSATYDAIKAFQLNMANSTTSDIANSKIRDIEASVTTFYNSLAGNFKMSGYGEDVLKNYVPAIVYTLYDGYYIYSAYDNKLDESTINSLEDDSTYSDGQEINGLKPYIYYSCRYKRGQDDFVITYTLDNYITIQGVIDGENVNDSGYLLTGVNKVGDNYTYRGITIGVEDGRNEGLSQKVYIPNETEKINDPETNTITTVEKYNPTDFENKIYVQDNQAQNQLAGWIVKYPFKKINGAKYYVGNITVNGEEVFSMINDEILPQNNKTVDSIINNDNAVNFYKEAYEFKDRVLNDYNLGDLSTEDAVDVEGNRYTDENTPFTIKRDIFKELLGGSDTYIEDENSDFNAHRLEVIKDSIESNLIVAISNYNKVSTSDVNFAMPKLEDYEWEQLTENISVITFLQGLNIGGKVYNGHAIVQNDINEDFVSEESIYLLDTQAGEYYKFTDPEVLNKDLNNTIGIYNVDFERRTGLATWRNPDGIDEVYEQTIYYYPRGDQASYNSIINPNFENSGQSISELMKEYASRGETSKEGQLAKLYYTALARERYGQYRVTRDDVVTNIETVTN